MKHPPKTKKSKKRPIKQEKHNYPTRLQKQQKIKEDSYSSNSAENQQNTYSEQAYSNENYECYSNNIKIKKNSRQENSLGELTKNFINYVRESGKVTININDLVRKLKVKKRRIYDITNVLEGIGYIKKHAKNEISWIKNEYFPGQKANKNFNANADENSSDSDDLGLKEAMNKKMTPEEYDNLFLKCLDKSKKYATQIQILQNEFDNISQKPDFREFGYVTLNDLKKMSRLENLDLLVIKAPRGTYVDIIDPKDAKEAYINYKGNIDSNIIERDEVLLETLKKEHHLFLDSPTGKIVIYRVSKDDYNLYGLNAHPNTTNPKNIGDNPRAKALNEEEN